MSPLSPESAQLMRVAAACAAAARERAPWLFLEVTHDNAGARGRLARWFLALGSSVRASPRKQRATLVEVGGAIREYHMDGRPVIEPFRVADGAHGAPLVPWPNRLGGGRYRFDGRDHQLH